MTKQMNTLQEMLEVLRIPEKWDLILAGDGSGSRWNNPGGWACTVITRNRMSGTVSHLTPFVGAVSRGSINWLEALPYWHCIRHHYHDCGGKKLAQRFGGLDVHIVSDSSWVVNAMSGMADVDVHEDMCMLFAFYQSKGYRLHWHHANRESSPLNRIADKLAAEAREYIDAIEPPLVDPLFPLTA